MKLYFHQQTYKQLQGLPRHVFATALQTIIGLADDPRPRGCIKLTGQADQWRIRIGMYRVVYRIDDAAAEVTILNVDKRSDVYR